MKSVSWFSVWYFSYCYVQPRFQQHTVAAGCWVGSSGALFCASLPSPLFILNLSPTLRIPSRTQGIGHASHSAYFSTSTKMTRIYYLFSQIYIIRLHFKPHFFFKKVQLLNTRYKWTTVIWNHIAGQISELDKFSSCITALLCIHLITYINLHKPTHTLEG